MAGCDFLPSASAWQEGKLLSPLASVTARTCSQGSAANCKQVDQREYFLLVSFLVIKAQASVNIGFSTLCPLLMWLNGLPEGK